MAPAVVPGCLGLEKGGGRVGWPSGDDRLQGNAAGAAEGRRGGRRWLRGSGLRGSRAIPAPRSLWQPHISSVGLDMLLDRVWDPLCGSVPVGSVGDPGAETLHSGLAAPGGVQGWREESPGTWSSRGHRGRT